VDVTCTNCSRSFQVPDDLAGRRGHCLYCGALFDVPADVAVVNVADLRRLEVPPQPPGPHDYGPKAARERPSLGEWGRYVSGLSCIQVAMWIGMAIIVMAFVLAMRWVGRDAVPVLLAILAWLVVAGVMVLLVGRALCLSPPQAKARSAARASFVLTLIASAFLVIAIVAAFSVAQKGMDEATLAFYGYSGLICTVCGLIAELLCQISLRHVGAHFRDGGVRAWSTVMMGATCICLGLVAVLVIVAVVEAQTHRGNAGGFAGRGRDAAQSVGAAGELLQADELPLFLFYLAAYLVALRLAKKAIRSRGQTAEEELVFDYEDEADQEW
jgi:hypothetical protein